MSYQELRKGRLSESGRAYFITTVTHQRSALFLDLYSARIVINHMKYLDEVGWVKSLSWVVMPDHVHWLFQLKDAKNLSVVMKHFKARITKELNRKINRSGPVWQKAFYDRAIRDNEDLQRLARYIVANPLRAGLVENIENYPHWDAVWL